MPYLSTVVKNKKSFTVTTGLVTVDTNNEKPLILLRNPATSENKILITHFKFGTDSSNVRSLVRIYKMPTITSNGTALTPTNTYVGPDLPASSVEAYKFPTLSDNGDVLNLDINPSDSPSKGLNRKYWIEPGYDLVLTTENSSANAKTFADVYWLEGV